MLNRIFIVVGAIAILILTAAFVVPALIPWNDFRDRLAAMASEVSGTPVRIEGDVSFTLLPQPILRFADVSAGPQDSHRFDVESVEAEFSLVDFLRDRYTITRLVLKRPQATVVVAEDGTVDAGLAVPAGTSNVSVERAEITDGGVLLRDVRSGREEIIGEVEGELRLGGAEAFSFQGRGNWAGTAFFSRVTGGASGSDGTMPLSFSVAEDASGPSLTGEGRLTPGANPQFAGELVYRQPPPLAIQGSADAGRGPLSVTATVEATPARVLLKDYVVIPDENRAVTRLQGAAELTLGAASRFNAVISGGVLSMPPPDATADAGGAPYEIVQLLSELPLPPIPPIPGTVGLDIADVDLQAFSLRNVRLDAEAGPDGWTLKSFIGTLPGDTRLFLSGDVQAVDGRPEFGGRLSISSPRLDLLAAQWRRPDPGNPLLDMGGSLTASVALVGETLSLSDGKFEIDGQSRGFSAQIGLGTMRDLHLNADLGALDASHSAALLALLPDATEPALGASFPKGEFDLVADLMDFGGIEGRALTAKGSWDGGVLVLDEISAGDLGGAALKLNLTAFGSVARPEMSGSGTVTLGGGDAPLADWLFRTLDTPPEVADFVRRFAPADLAFRLTAPSGAGEQTLMLSGTAGATQISADVAVEAGLPRLLDGRVEVSLDVQGPDPAALSAQLGLGDEAILAADQPMHIVGKIAGEVQSSFEATLLASGGTESIGFSGRVAVTDPARWNGRGSLKAQLGDPTILADGLGLSGLALPAFDGEATLEFDGPESVKLSGITGHSGRASYSGDLTYRKTPQSAAISGTLGIDRLDLSAIAGLMVGNAAFVGESDGVWPSGPVSLGTVARPVSGAIDVSVASLVEGDTELAHDAKAIFEWNATETTLRRMTAAMGDGGLTGEVTLCCAGLPETVQLNGRVSLDRVPIGRLLPEAAANAITGRVSGALQYAATGGSIAELARALGGEGSFTVSDLTVAALSPSALSALDGAENLVDADAAELSARVEAALAAGPFRSGSTSGTLSLAAGTLRSPNLSLQAEDGELFGSVSLSASDLSLGGSFALTRGLAAAAAAPDTAAAPTGGVTIGLAGTLMAPARVVDASGLVDAAMVQAFEAEVARLEKLRAEEEARRKADEAAAAEAARIAAEEKAKAEAEAARKAAEQEAARRAAEQNAAESAEPTESSDPSPPVPLPPLDLGINPPAF